MSDPDLIIVPKITVMPHYENRQYAKLAYVVLNLLTTSIADMLLHIFGDVSYDVQYTTDHENLAIKRDVLRMVYRPSSYMRNSPLENIELYLVVDSYANKADSIPQHRVIVKYGTQAIDLTSNAHVTYMAGNSLDKGTSMLSNDQLKTVQTLTVKLSMVLIKILSAKAASHTS